MGPCHPFQPSIGADSNDLWYPAVPHELSPEGDDNSLPLQCMTALAFHSVLC